MTVCAAVILCLAAAASQNNSQTSMKNRPDQQPARARRSRMRVMRIHTQIPIRCASDTCTIIEAIYGRQREEMEAALTVQGLKEEREKLDARDEILQLDLTGRDPDEGSTSVPDEKGALFLRYLEETFGREKFDQFLKGYFDHFAFQSITTADFVA